MTGRNRFPSELKLVLMAATMIFLFGLWEHLPMMTPSHYTDIASVYWREGIGAGDHLIPYYDYMFEYPVLVGMLVYACSSVRVFISDFSAAMNYYFIATSAVLYVFAMGTIVALYRVLEKVGGDHRRIWKCFLITPTFLMFTVYNWDIIAIFFSTLSLLYFLKGEKGKADLSIGLGVAAKLYPCMLIPVYMMEEKTWPGRLRRLVVPIAFYGLLNAPFLLLNPHTWFETIKYHASWGIENSWLIFFFDQMDQNAHYVGLAVLVYLVYKGLLESSRKKYKTVHERVVQRIFLMNVAWLLGNYVVTPQMALMLLPYYVLLPMIPLAAIYLVEVLNALIIVMWFTPQLSLGNPLVSSSPVQWSALGRQLVWLGLFIYILYPEKVKNWSVKLFQRLGE